MKNDWIVSAYLDMINETSDQKFAYDGTKFVNRPPTDAEKEREKKLGDLWKKTATMSKEDYIKSLKNMPEHLKDTLVNEPKDAKWVPVESPK